MPASIDLIYKKSPGATKDAAAKIRTSIIALRVIDSKPANHRVFDGWTSQWTTAIFLIGRFRIGGGPASGIVNQTRTQLNRIVHLTEGVS